MPRRIAAVVCAAAGVASVGVGAWLTWGPGMGVLVVGALVVTFAVLLGWE